MKVLFAVENYYPKMSGVPNVVKYLAEGLVEKGNEVAIVTRHIEGYKDEEIINSIKIFRKNIFYNKVKGFSGDCNGYVNFIKNFDCDVIILECSQCITTDLVLPHLENIDKIKIFHSHGFSGSLLKPIKICPKLKNTIGNTYNWLRWKRYYKGFFKKYIKDFDATMVLSEIDSSKEYLIKNSLKTYILPNAGEDMFFEGDILKNKILKYTNLENKEYFISVANYQEYKNQIGILKAYFLTNVKGYDLIFIGSEKNEYYEKLISIAKDLEKKYGRRPVHFLVGVQRKDIPSIIQGAKLYLVGSNFEEFSISLIEAMALGVPFISTNVGNARLLPGGITIDNISGMSNEIEHMIKENTKYDELSNEGRKYSNKFCRIERVVENLMNIIEECQIKDKE